MLKGKIKDKSDRTIWAEFKHGWEIKLRHTTRAEFQKLCERASNSIWKGAEEKRIDPKEFAAIVGKEVIVDWRNLTPDALRKLVEMDEYPLAELSYSAEDAAELLDKVPGLDAWVIEITGKWEYFDAARRAEETKNS